MMTFLKPFLIGLFLSGIFYFWLMNWAASLGFIAFAAIILLPMVFAPVIIGTVIGLIRLFKR